MNHAPRTRLAGALALAFPLLGQAQTTDQDKPMESVVVTGSRVIVNGDNSPTPVTAVRAQDLLSLQPSTIADALNTLPVFSSPRNQTSNPSAGGAAVSGGGNPASNQLNLRNLGAVRTLVLFDGHRVAPTTANGTVDVDMIPQMILKRVDVVTGGASAVYGSDAISGVVNFVTDNRFNGLKTNIQAGIAEKGDARQSQFGVAYGTSIGDKGHFVGSYEFRDDKGILYRSSRPATALTTIQGAGTAALPYFVAGDTRLATSSFGGYVRTGVLAGQQFGANGVLTAFDKGNRTGFNPTVPTQSGGDGAYYDGSLKAPLRSHQLFGRFDYDFSDTTRGYVEVAGNLKRNAFYANWPLLNGVTISRDNAFLPTAYRDQLLAANQATFTLGKVIQTAPRMNPVIDEHQLFVNAGLDGEFGNGYKWEAGYVHSVSSMLVTTNGNLNNLRLSAALDAVAGADGTPVCRVTLTNPTAFPGCVPLNVFGPGSESAAAISYILGDTHFNAHTFQDDISGSISGAPFSTWAGPVSVAVSGDWRRQAYRATSDATSSDPANLFGCAANGLRFNCTQATQPWFQPYSNRSRVAQTVKEAALEFNAPVLKDAAWARTFDVNGAVRYTNYDTSGTYLTWKVGADWHLNDEVRLRSTRSRDIRAPTLDDLFASATTASGSNATDSLLGVQSTAPNTTKANPDLKAEKGDTTTVGVVYQSSRVRGFSLALDAFDIKVSDAITQVQGTNFSYQAACYASGGTSPLCATQIRALGNFQNTPGNVVTQWFSFPINFAKVHTWGADFEANYATSIQGRPLTLRGLVTWQPHLRYMTPGLPTQDMGGVAYGANGLQASPVWRTTLFARFNPTKALTLDVMERWRSALALSADPTQVTTGSVKSFATTNLNIDYRIKLASGTVNLYANVQNLFNRIPPGANFSGTQQNPGQFGGFPMGDDPVGRYVAAGLRFNY
ncbi:TonB-dependent receptor [Telluria mixta]|uniref:TonB-dependent receptor n=1 Tax=Telluria mixta TaxID=34071 RepID=A0ABT2C1F9_9BURK|nr:TonB-dependent receptor [Telluria mixta]MCS0631161.1 TonB-dependent receptor [Telluria mixta]WEM95699.1 TonB-dependent receptor [Telluria mixta]